MEKKTLTLSVGGREIIFETGQIARHANGAVMAKMGETFVLSTACAAKKAADDIDFFPLRIDYTEKFSSAGKTLGGFIKREGRPTEREILVCRLIDRPLRPMFEDGYFNEVQVLSYVMSYDGVHMPEPLAICAASAALTISDIPLIKPVAAVRVGMIDGNFVINPTLEEMKRSKLDLVIAGTEDAVLMIEGYCDFLSEEEVMQAVDEGHAAIRIIAEGLERWREEVGREKKIGELKRLPEELLKGVEEKAMPYLKQIVDTSEKLVRLEATEKAIEELLAHYCPKEGEPLATEKEVQGAFKAAMAKHLRHKVLTEGKRCDGRNCDQVRPITIEMGLLPRTHGSALFTRGETQSIAVCTLGGETMGQRYEDLNEDAIRKFYLQYSFPPFSVGEVGRAGPPGRREVGHGKLAERALSAAIPSAEEFPYVIRLESNITESNGSSSMASVCGGALAMMEAGVPLKHPVAGIAMGLILEGEKYAILSDILGIEDALGDMDFKITGNESGITAFQLDIKIEGITPKIMRVALEQAKQGRLHILQKMLEACPKPKTELSKHAPRIEQIRVKPSKIGAIIGPGGKMIRQITEESGAQIDINDDGIVSIAATSKESMDKARRMVEAIVAEAEVGKVYKGTVKSVVAFGLFVEILPDIEGLCHISEIANERVNDLPDRYKVGDEIEVKVIEVNDRGQIRLSRKVLLPETANQ